MGKGIEGDEGTGVTALYTHLCVSLDCYPLVTPLVAHRNHFLIIMGVRQLPVVASDITFRYREVVEFCAG